MLEDVQEIGGRLIIKGYRKIAAQNGCAPTAKTSDKKIMEIYTQVSTVFSQAARQRREKIPALYLNTVILKFLQVHEMMGDHFQHHLQYEANKYLTEGLRPDYKRELPLFDPNNLNDPDVKRLSELHRLTGVAIHTEKEVIKSPTSSKKQITKEKMGQELWQLCCDAAEEFCIYFRPKFQELGFLSTPIKDTAFMNEVMMLHLWIISSVLGSEDSEVLDILHNNFRSFHPAAYNPTAAGNIRERYEHYHEAQLLDMKLDTKETPSYMVPWAALQCLLNDGKPIEENFNLKLVTETNRFIYLTSGRIRKKRGEFDICEN